MSVLPPHPEQSEAREENHPSANERALGSFQSLISFDNDLALCWSRRSGGHVTYTASPLLPLKVRNVLVWFTLNYFFWFSNDFQGVGEAV